MVTATERWSELANGASVPQETRVVGFDKKTRSIIDEDEGLTLVGSLMT